MNCQQSLTELTAINLIRQHQIRHLPVLSKTGELVGLISTQTRRDCLQPTENLWVAHEQMQ